jgi:hypothetical protein
MNLIKFFLWSFCHTRTWTTASGPVKRLDPHHGRNETNLSNTETAHRLL